MSADVVVGEIYGGPSATRSQSTPPSPNTAPPPAEEVQDNNGATDNGTVAADQTWARLISAISAISAISGAGGPAYGYRQIDPVNDSDGGAPGGSIRQGFLFRHQRAVLRLRYGGRLRPGGRSPPR